MDRQHSKITFSDITCYDLMDDSNSEKNEESVTEYSYGIQ